MSAAFLLRSACSTRTRLTLAASISIPTVYLSSQLLHLPLPRSRILHCQTAPSLLDRAFEPKDARTRGSTIFSPTDFHQISVGSFAGVMAGYAVGRLSRLFAFVAILVVLVVQYAERKGLHIVPWQRLRGVVSEVDTRRMATENWAFKYSFGSAFALSAWFAN